MTTEHTGSSPEGARTSSSVLADRIAVLLLSRDPGWRIPRPSMLARRYNASIAEVNAAIGQLIERQLLRRLPDGQLYRPSPAEYLISLEGVSGLSRIDPMGASVACTSTHVSWGPVPEDIGLMLGLPSGSEATVVRRMWAANGARAAMTMTYLRGHLDAAPGPDEATADGWMLDSLTVPVGPITGSRAVPAALQLECQPPAPSVARHLQLAPAVPVLAVAVRFDDRVLGLPVALTIAFLRCDLFRIAVEAPTNGLPAWALGEVNGWTPQVAESEQ